MEQLLNELLLGIYFGRSRVFFVFFFQCHTLILSCLLYLDQGSVEPDLYRRNGDLFAKMIELLAKLKINKYEFLQ